MRAAYFFVSVDDLTGVDRDQHALGSSEQFDERTRPVWDQALDEVTLIVVSVQQLTWPGVVLGFDRQIVSPDLDLLEHAHVHHQVVARIEPSPGQSASANRWAWLEPNQPADG